MASKVFALLSLLLLVVCHGVSSQNSWAGCVWAGA